MQSNFPRVFFILIIAFCFINCATKPRGVFDAQRLPPRPDYQLLDHWAAHPEKVDSADLVPTNELQNLQDTAMVDVFFLHPTTYTRRPGNKNWNGSIEETKLQVKTSKFPIKYQATVFNGSARIFAPYYRQAHLHAYYTKKKIESANKAWDVAYQDIEDAFLHYLKYENNGRPFIIAGHSQGTHHAIKLIQEYIDGKSIQHQLIVAYLIGMPVRKDIFNEISPCESDLDTQCYCSWRTWLRGHAPNTKRDTFQNLLVTNPLTWKTEGYASIEMNKGTILKNFHKIYMPGLTDAEVREKILWVNRPKFPFSFLFRMRNYHVADYNFFWMNLRKNIQTRIFSFLNKERS